MGLIARKSVSRTYVLLLLLLAAVSLRIMLETRFANSIRGGSQATAGNKTLVVLLGNARGGEAAWRSLYTHVLDPSMADLALMFGATSDHNSSLYRRARYIWETPERDSWNAVLDGIAAATPGTDGAAAFRRIEAGPNETAGGPRAMPGVGPMRMVFSPEVIPTRGLGWRRIAVLNDGSVPFNGLFGGTTTQMQLGQGLTSLYMNQQRKGSGAIIFALRWLLSQHIQQLRLLDRYDRFVVTRSDHVYGCTHNVAALDLNKVWVPEGEDYGGITERHIVCSRADILACLAVMDPVLQFPEQYADFVGSPEVLLRRRLEESGLWPRVRRFPRVMFTAAKKTDTTRWKKFTEDNQYVHQYGGLYVKYKEELTGMLAGCKLARSACSREYDKLDEWDFERDVRVTNTQVSMCDGDQVEEKNEVSSCCRYKGDQPCYYLTDQNLCAAVGTSIPTTRKG